MVRAFERGLCLNDFENMTVGMILGYVITYNNLNSETDEEEEKVREATQADFDAF